MAYTAAQYAAQNRVMSQIRLADLDGLCPICHVRPRGVWPDGVRRITCGAFDCYYRWLNVRPASETHHSPIQNPDDK